MCWGSPSSFLLDWTRRRRGRGRRRIRRPRPRKRLKRMRLTRPLVVCGLQLPLPATGRHQTWSRASGINSSRRPRRPSKGSSKGPKGPKGPRHRRSRQRSAAPPREEKASSRSKAPSHSGPQGHKAKLMPRCRDAARPLSGGPSAIAQLHGRQAETLCRRPVRGARKRKAQVSGRRPTVRWRPCRGPMGNRPRPNFRTRRRNRLTPRKFAGLPRNHP